MKNELFYVEGNSFKDFYKNNRGEFQGINISPDFKSITIVNPPKNILEIVDIAYKLNINVKFQILDKDITQEKINIMVKIIGMLTKRGNISKSEVENIIDQTKKVIRFKYEMSEEELESLL